MIGDKNGFFLYFMKNDDVVKFKYPSEYEINKLIDQIKEQEENDGYRTLMTDLLKAVTMSVNGNTDVDFISLYVDNMNAEDAYLYRTFVSDNMPRIDAKIKLNVTDNQEMYVQLLIDDEIFLNV